MDKKRDNGKRAVKDLTAKDAASVKGGLPSLDAGIHFKYDIKAQKEA